MEHNIKANATVRHQGISLTDAFITNLSTLIIISVLGLVKLCLFITCPRALRTTWPVITCTRSNSLIFHFLTSQPCYQLKVNSVNDPFMASVSKLHCRSVFMVSCRFHALDCSQLCDFFVCCSISITFSQYKICCDLIIIISYNMVARQT